MAKHWDSFLSNCMSQGSHCIQPTMYEFFCFDIGIEKQSWLIHAIYSKAMAHSTKCIIFSQIRKETNMPIPGRQWDTSGFVTGAWQQCH